MAGAQGAIDLESTLNTIRWRAAWVSPLEQSDLAASRRRLRVRRKPAMPPPRCRQPVS